MRTGSAVFWVVVAAVLGVLAVVISPEHERIEGAAEVGFGLVQSEIAGVRVSEGGQTTSIFRSRGSDAWFVEWTGADGETRRWAANPDRVRAGVRLLATARFAERPGGEVSDGEAGGTVVEVFDASDTGAARWVTIGSGGIGGRVPAVLDPGTPVWVDAALTRALTHESLMQWRSELALVVENPTRVSVEAGGNSVVLSRSGGSWRVDGDPHLHVNQATVEAAVRDLAQVRVTRFLRETPDAAGLSNPGARITVEGASGSRTVTLGAPADADRREYFATVGGRDGAGEIGPVAARVESAKLGAVSAAAIAYLGETVIVGDRFDVAGVTITDAAGAAVLDATRSYDGWRGPGGAVLAESDAVEALVVGVGADRARVPFEPVEVEILGTVRLRGLVGAVEAGVGRDGDGRVVFVVGASFGDVQYAYDPAAHPWCAWVLERLEGGRG